MPLVLGERVLETSTTTGTSAFVLNGATVGFQSFFDKVGNGNTCYYTIRNRTVPAEWETGIGTISGTSASGILTRTTIISSSTGSAVSFSAGTKDIFDTLPASKSVYTDTNNKLLIDTTTSLEVETTNMPISMPSLNLDFARSKQLDPRITFGRGSVATYYDGKSVALAEQNLLTYSQDFRDTADAESTRPWVYSGITNTYGVAIAPDGTATANYLQETATTAMHILASSPVNSVTLGATAALSITCYFKKGLGLTAPDWIQINTGGASSTYANFNLTTGLVGNYGGGSGISATNPINVGAGWYRCIITLATAGSGIHYFYPGFTNNTNPTSRYPSYLGTITSDVQMWGFQAEQRSSVTTYTPTTTSAITNYIPVLVSAPSNVPRFDHDSRPSFNATATVSGSTVTLPTTFADGSSPSSVNNYYKGSITVASVSYPIVSYKGSTQVLTVTGTPTTGSQAIVLTNKNYGQSLGLLIEEARTNLLTYSANFTNWNTTSNVDIVQNCIIAPDGTLTGTKFIPNSNNTAHSTYINATGLAANTYYTYSFYAKKGETNFITIFTNNTYNAFDYSYTVFNLDTGTASILATGSTTNTYSITPVGDGWYRCTVTDKTMSTSIGTARTYFYVHNSNSAFIGNGYSGIYIWGAQLEVGSFATSYIPTPSNATVSRNADSASMTGTNFSSWYNQSQGSIYAEYAAKGIVNYAGIFEITDTYTWNRGLSLANNTTDTAVYYGTGSATLAVTSLPDPVVNVINKAVVTYTNTSIGLCLNSVNLSSTTVPNSPFYGSLFIGKQTVTGADQTVSGHIRKISYYPQALSKLELQGLTK